jgi:photoactive yellow protein
MFDDLTRLAPEEIDSLPFGYVALAADGTVRRYNRYEADLAQKNPAEVLGKNFFREVAPCTQVQEFAGRFASFLQSGEPSLSFEFTFRFRHGDQRVRITFVRAPLPGEVIMTVLRVRALGMPMSAAILPDPVFGRLTDERGTPITVGNTDFWRSLRSLWALATPEIRREALHRLGFHWGRAHLERLERLLQRERGLALREAELATAIELVSGSLAVLGLGQFSVDFSHRDQGLLVVRHQASPFPAIFDDTEGPVCDVLAGFHAAMISHLSGQSLVGHEVFCAQRPGESCIFAVATERRMSRLLEAQPGTADAAWLASLTRQQQPLATGATA